MLAELDIDLKATIQLILLASHQIINKLSHSCKEIMRDGAATKKAIGLREDNAILALGGEERGDIGIIDKLDTSSLKLD